MLPIRDDLATELARRLHQAERRCSSIPPADAYPDLSVADAYAVQRAHIARKGYVLETGRVVLSDLADNLRRNEEVRRSYLGY